METLDGTGDRRYAVTVGARLRAIRAQQRLSLQEVEQRSGEEFKASVLGAYERGERAISVARLQRLARFYEVPVDQLLPADDGPAFGPRPGDLAPGEARGNGVASIAPVRIDLSALAKLDGSAASLLARFVRLIQIQRGDYNGQVLTLRRSDFVALGCMLDVAPDAVPARLEELGVLYGTVRA